VRLNRLQDAVDCTLRDEQAGYRKGRSCTEQIFTLRNIIEQSLEHQQDLIINFIDFRKAFDSVHRPSLWKILTYYGIPERFINIFKALYDNSSCCVKTASGYTEFFEIVSGVRQGCILSLFLFIIVIDFVMRRTMDHGIVWQKRNRLTDLDFADDIAIVAEEENVCQEMTAKFEEQSAQVGLNISREKTKTMGITQRSSPQPVAIAQENIEYVERFTYLGSVISSDGDAEADINTRLAKAAAVFRRLDNMWRSSTLSLKIKLDLYTSLVVSTAIYASETWKSTARICQQLDVFHQRNLRKILGITWKEHVTDMEVLSRTWQRRLQDIVAERRLWMAGHIIRMPPG